MICVIYGGSASGKSSFAEQYAMDIAKGKKFYVATMQVWDKESERRVERHRAMRDGKGFVTIECPKDLADKVNVSGTVLIECMSNLVANEMFVGNEVKPEDEVVEKLVRELKLVSQKAENVIVVSNNIFEDGCEYDETTKCYMRALGRVNSCMADMANSVYEVVVGIGLRIK